MNNRHLVFALRSLPLAAGCDGAAARRALIEKAQAQVRGIAADLDKKTTDTGVYVRAKEDEIKEPDPWGTRIKVSYSQGGVAEVVTVSSAGPDREFNTADDIVAVGVAVNLKGIGEGIKKNAEETAAKAAKGVVKGTVEGVKESIKGSSRSKKRDAKVDDEPNESS